MQAEILIVEVNEHSVPWMAPNDLSTLEAVELLASASESNHGTGIIVGLATGSVDMVYKPNHSAGVDEWLVRHSGIGSGEEESIVITE